MNDEFLTSVFDRLKWALPDLDPASIMEGLAVYQQGGPKAGQVTYRGSYAPSGAGNARIIAVTVDVDVWAKGPDYTDAEEIANKVEAAFIDWRVNTGRQGTVRITGFARDYLQHEDEELGHVTMRFTGRGFRRIET